MKQRPATSRPAQRARCQPMKIASSVELGPGMRLVTPRRSRNSAWMSQPRRRTTSSSIKAIWAAGPPKAVMPSLRNSRANSPRCFHCPAAGGVASSTRVWSAIAALRDLDPQGVQAGGARTDDEPNEQGGGRGLGGKNRSAKDHRSSPFPASGHRARTPASLTPAIRLAVGVRLRYYRESISESKIKMVLSSAPRARSAILEGDNRDDKPAQLRIEFREKDRKASARAKPTR